MTKTHEVIEIDGGYVVVDKEAIKKDSWCLYDRYPKVIAKATSDMMGTGSANRIIASIGKNIEGVPLIEIPDTNNKLYTEEDIKKMFEAGWQSRNNCGYKINDTYQEDYNKAVKSLQPKIKSVELEYQEATAWGGWDGKSWELKISKENTIIPKSINYES